MIFQIYLFEFEKKNRKKKRIKTNFAYYAIYYKY